MQAVTKPVTPGGGGEQVPIGGVMVAGVGLEIASPLAVVGPLPHAFWALREGRQRVRITAEPALDLASRKRGAVAFVETLARVGEPIAPPAPEHAAAEVEFDNTAPASQPAR